MGKSMIYLVLNYSKGKPAQPLTKLISQTPTTNPQWRLGTTSLDTENNFISCLDHLERLGNDPKPKKKWRKNLCLSIEPLQLPSLRLQRLQRYYFSIKAALCVSLSRRWKEEQLCRPGLATMWNHTSIQLRDFWSPRINKLFPLFEKM